MRTSGLITGNTSLLFAVDARRQLAAGAPRRAIETCKLGLARYPDHSAGYVVLAAAYRAVGEDERARLVLRRGFERTGLEQLRTLSELASDTVAADVTEAPGDVIEEAAAPEAPPAEPIVEADGQVAPIEEAPTAVAIAEHVEESVGEPSAVLDAGPAEETAEPAKGAAELAEATAAPAEAAAGPAEATAEPAAAAELRQERPAELIAEPLPEPAAERPAEPVTELVTEPVSEPVSERVAESSAAPVAEPVAEPPAEPVTESPAASSVEPVEEFVAEPPGFEAPVEITRADVEPHMERAPAHDESPAMQAVEPALPATPEAPVASTSADDSEETHSPLELVEERAESGAATSETITEGPREESRPAAAPALLEKPIERVPWFQRRPQRTSEQTRPSTLALHSGKSAHRLRSANLRLIPGLEFAPLRAEDHGRGRMTIAPIMEDPLPDWEPRRRPAVVDDAPPLPEYPSVAETSARSQPEPSRSEPTLLTRPAELERALERVVEEPIADEEEETDEDVSEIDELARRLEGARIAPVGEAPTQQKHVFEPAIVSDTLADILVKQGAYGEAIKAFMTLARTRPQKLRYYEERIAEMKRLIEAERSAGG